MRRAICARKWGLCIVSHLTATDVVAQQFGWVHTLWSRDVVDVCLVERQRHSCVLGDGFFGGYLSA